jgi:hypothetical protein
VPATRNPDSPQDRHRSTIAESPGFAGAVDSKPSNLLIAPAFYVQPQLYFLAHKSLLQFTEVNSAGT